MPGPKCDKYGVVETGSGVVTVHCIRTGRHRLHKLEHEWVETDDTTVVHENVFEK